MPTATLTKLALNLPQMDSLLSDEGQNLIPSLLKHGGRSSIVKHNGMLIPVQ